MVPKKLRSASARRLVGNPCPLAAHASQLAFGESCDIRRGGGINLSVVRVGDTEDGSILWTVAEHSDSGRLPTAYGLLTQDSTGSPELRDPQTGELRRLWPQVHGTKVAVQGKWAAIADFDVVWLLDLSTGNQSP